MIGVILNLYAAYWFSREAYGLGLRTSKLTARRWYWYLLLVYLGFAGLTMLSLAVSSGTVRQDDYWPFVFSYALGRTIIILVPSLIAWLVGVIRKKPEIGTTEMFYASQDGDVMGPFEASQIAPFISNGSLRHDVKLCKEGSTQWVEWEDLQTRIGEAPHKTGWQKRLADWLRLKQETLKASPTMNYRIFIPSIVVALIFGALLHSWLGERYRVFAAGEGFVIKVDRWTGETWRSYAGGGIWVPFKETQSP